MRPGKKKEGRKEEEEKKKSLNGKREGRESREGGTEEKEINPEIRQRRRICLKVEDAQEQYLVIVVRPDVGSAWMHDERRIFPPPPAAQPSSLSSSSFFPQMWDGWIFPYSLPFFFPSFPPSQPP